MNTSLFSKEDMLFFHANGFLIKRNFLEAEHCNSVVDVAWSFLPESFDIKNKKTWKGEVTCSCDVTQSIKKRRGHIKVRKESIGKNTIVRKLVEKNEKIINAVGELIGMPLGLPIFRGLYFTFPIPRIFSYPHYGHIESHPFQVGVVAYCSNVRKNGGGLSIWPGSHWRFQEVFDNKLGFYANEHYYTLAKYYNAIKPLTIEGDVGDVIFTHHRLYHAPSNNNVDTPRAAFFCDFRAESWAELEQQKATNNPFETFNNLSLYSKDDSKSFLVKYNSSSEVLRFLSVKYPLINKCYSRLISNPTTIARSKLSMKARFDK
jgi:hypothetical protein